MPSVSAVVLDTIDDIIQSEPQSPKPASPEKTLVTIIDVEENASDVCPAASPSSSSSELHETKDDAGSQTPSHDGETAPPVLPRSPGSRYKVNGRRVPEPTGVTTVIVNGRVVTPEMDKKKDDMNNARKADGDVGAITMDRTVPAPRKRSIYEKAKDRGVDKVVLRLNREAAGNEPGPRQVGLGCRTLSLPLSSVSLVWRVVALSMPGWPLPHLCQRHDVTCLLSSCRSIWSLVDLSSSSLILFPCRALIRVNKFQLHILLDVVVNTSQFRCVS